MNIDCRKFMSLPSHDGAKSTRNAIKTKTSREQEQVEIGISTIINYLKSYKTTNADALRRENHIAYLRKNIRKLHCSLSCLDASRPWMVYWICHALEILGEDIEAGLAEDIIQFLSQCQSPEGGFGGGPMQMPHLAPTYAAICALCIVGTEDAFNVINREKLYTFLMKIKRDDGSFTMHEGGEVDIRGVYCAVAVAKLTNIVTEELFSGTPDWLLMCQTYEGGFSGAPGLEAHGGYTYCGVAALHLLNSLQSCQLDELIHWAVSRQMRFEGGFQGRTNKLVDGCYSFWQGGLFPILHDVLKAAGGQGLSNERWMFHQEALQEYLIFCCQNVKGGLIDKPGKPADFYHTCYTLSGLSVAQHFESRSNSTKCVVGGPCNELVPVNYLFNIGVHAANFAQDYFKSLPPVLQTDSL